MELIPKHQTRVKGFDEKILAMYARGMSMRDMQTMLEELYQVEVSEALISSVNDAVLDDVRAWQSRPLDPLERFGLLRLRRRQGASGGAERAAGMWISPNEEAKFWLGVMTWLKDRGAEDILIAAVDGLVGFPDAIATIFPKTEVQLCIVRMMRNSTRYVSWKDRKELYSYLKTIYSAATTVLLALSPLLSE